jgi:hypothetical protein
VQASIDLSLYPLAEELQHSWETHGRAVLVSKMVLGDVRPDA